MSDRNPIVDDDSRPYWQALREHRLELQRCTRCERFVFYPRVLCPHCHGMSLQWQEVSGSGVIYSFTVSRRAAAPSLSDAVPYVVALIDLDEGVRMLSNIRTEDVASVHIGQRVQVGFDDISPDATLPYFVHDAHH